MKTTRLGIDTSRITETVVSLLGTESEDEYRMVPKNGHSQTTVPAVEELLAKSSMPLNGINEVTVSTGPGSFTGLRVGAAVGSAIGWLLSIPVNGKNPQEPVTLIYTDDRWG